jgi:hypothetical protein
MRFGDLSHGISMGLAALKVLEKSKCVKNDDLGLAVVSGRGIYCVVGQENS